MTPAMQRRENGRLVTYVFPHLKAVGLHHAISTRLGGQSQGPFASLNLSYSVGDDQDDVAANRRLFYAAADVQEGSVVSSHQVHGANVCRVGRQARGRGAIQPGTAIPATDALITDDRGTYLFMRYADCVPILLCDPVKRAVALVHAGWKGTVGNIVGATVKTMCRVFGCQTQDILAGIGPAVGPCHYAIQQDVSSQVRSALSFWPFVLHRGADDSLVMDLPEANVYQLLAAGLHQANVALSGICTACHSDEFYSHRAEGGRTGRFAALVGWPTK